MAKLFKSKPDESVEVPVTFLRKIPGTERFEVVTGVVRGPVTGLQTVENNASFVVARAAAERAFSRQKDAELLKLRDLPRA